MLTRSASFISQLRPSSLLRPIKYKNDAFAQEKVRENLPDFVFPMENEVLAQGLLEASN